MSPPPCHGGIASSSARASPEHADAGRPEELVPGEGSRSRSRAPARPPARCGTACAPSTSTGTPRARGHPAQLGDRVDGAERVRDVRHGQHPRPRGEQLLGPPQVELAGVGDRDRPDGAGAPPTSCHGTMLAWCSIAVTTISSPARSVAPPERLRHQVDRLGGAAGEDHLASGAAPRNRATRARARRPRRVACSRELIDAAMDVGVAALVEVASPHRSPRAASGWWPRCRDRPAACRATVVAEDRELGPNGRHIQRREAVGHADHPLSARSRTARHQRSRPIAHRLDRHFGQHFGAEGPDQQRLRRSGRRCRGSAGSSAAARRGCPPWRRGCTSRRRRRSRAAAWCRPWPSRRAAGRGWSAWRRSSAPRAHEDLAVEHPARPVGPGRPCRPPSCGSSGWSWKIAVWLSISCSPRPDRDRRAAPRCSARRAGRAGCGAPARRPWRARTSGSGSRAAWSHLGEADVIRRLALALHPRVLQPGIRARAPPRSRVGEVGCRRRRARRSSRSASRAAPCSITTRCAGRSRRRLRAGASRTPRGSGSSRATLADVQEDAVGRESRH